MAFRNVYWMLHIFNKVSTHWLFMFMSSPNPVRSKSFSGYISLVVNPFLVVILCLTSLCIILNICRLKLKLGFKGNQCRFNYTAPQIPVISLSWTLSLSPQLSKTARFWLGSFFLCYGCSKCFQVNNNTNKKAKDSNKRVYWIVYLLFLLFSWDTA